MQQPDDFELSEQIKDSDAHNIKYWQKQEAAGREFLEESGLNKPDSELTEEQKEEKDGLVEGIKEAQKMKRQCLTEALKEKTKNDFSKGADAGTQKRNLDLEDELSRKKKG